LSFYFTKHLKGFGVALKVENFENFTIIISIDAAVFERTVQVSRFDFKPLFLISTTRLELLIFETDRGPLSKSQFQQPLDHCSKNILLKLSIHVG